MGDGHPIDASLAGVNDQLNYQRKFLSPEHVQVTIPTLPFQSFEIFLPGFKVKPWELLNLIVSARGFTQWPARHADKPNESIIDSHLLMVDRAVFIVAMKMEICREFHDVTLPKFPLQIDANVTHTGKGSSRRRYIVKHPSMASPYAISDIDDVVINRYTKKPTQYPEWWKSKFSYINQVPKEKFHLPLRTGEGFATNECKVEYNHLDHNQHTTFSAYVLYCFNAMFENIMQAQPSVYKNINLKVLKEGVKEITMIFHKESKFGDKLLIESWEPEGTSREVQCHVKKLDGTHCSSVGIIFHPPKNPIVSKM